MIRVYSIPDCPFCDELKGYLKQGNIEYVEVDVNDNKNAVEFKSIYELTKCDDVPMVRQKNMIYVPNVSFTSISQLFTLIKENT